MGIDIGYFGDERLRKVGALLVERVAERQEVCLRKVGDDRAEQVKFRRFLLNESVTIDEMVSHRASLVTKAALGRHVLAIQDTSEINYEAQRGRKRRLGTVGNGTDVGLFVHPVLAIDADSDECLGLIDAQMWRRHKRKATNYKRLPIERKESYRWVKGGAQAKSVLAQASMVTILDDREGDIYEKWARLPDRSTHLLTRASQNRSLANGGSLFPTLAGFPEAHRYLLGLTAQPGKRSARQACIAVRFGPVRIRRPASCSDPNAPEEIELFAVEARELNPPAGEKPICWRLLTTHRAESVAQALQVIGWYRLRWHIEQLFRTLQLVLARNADGQDTPAERVFDERQIEVLHALQAKLQGRTSKQKNPYRSNSLAWAAWTIARLGGWTGYESERSTGPITMRDGLQRFNSLVDGYDLAKNVCSS